MADIKIQNIVASTSIAKNLNLHEIKKSLKNTSYTPDIFPGLVLRINKPKTAFLLFKSGKVVCTGGKNIEEIREAIKKVGSMLKNAGFKVIEEEKIEYEPEIFPGMVYRMEEPRVVLLLFGSGKIVCTGARKPGQVTKAMENLRKELKEKGLI